MPVQKSLETYIGHHILHHTCFQKNMLLQKKEFRWQGLYIIDGILPFEQNL